MLMIGAPAFPSKPVAALLAVIVAAVGLQPPAASADSSVEYVTNWPANALRYWYIDDGVPLSMRSDIKVGADKWSDRADGKAVEFVYGGEISATGNQFNCSQPVNTVFALGAVQLESAVGQSGTLGFTNWCRSGGLMTKFNITFVKNPNGSEYSGASGWNYGESAPGANEWDFRSTSIHEFGHASGYAFVGCSFSGHFCEVASTCPTANADRQTMCPGRSGNLATTYRRTLENHDKHTLDNAY